MTQSEAMQFITDFYRNPNPGEDDKFLFEEAQLFLIRNYHDPKDMHNLAFHYLEQRRHDLELKYLEMAAEYDYPQALEELGYIWYYGQTGEVDYKKAYEYFTRAAETNDDFVTPWALHKIADMYHNGYFVKKDEMRYRKMVQDLYRDMTEPSGKYYRYHFFCMPYADIAWRYGRILAEEGRSDEALKILMSARAELSENIRDNPAWWGNIEVMDEVVSLQYELGYKPHKRDVFDLFGLAGRECVVAFLYEDRRFLIEVVKDDEGYSLKFDHKWYRTAREFFEKAKIDGQKIVYIYDELYKMEVNYG